MYCIMYTSLMKLQNAIPVRPIHQESTAGQHSTDQRLVKECKQALASSAPKSKFELTDCLCFNQEWTAITRPFS